MPFYQADSLRYWTFSSFADFPLDHAIFSRQGGVSPAPFSSLNLSRAIGDDDKNVRANEELVFAAFGRSIDSAADSLLQHGTQHILFEKPSSTRNGHIQYADILLTKQPGVSLFMRYGDCLPILFVDKKKHAIALAHAGWRGTLLGVAVEALAAMESHFQSRPQDIAVAIGPGICAVHYEVGDEVTAAVYETMPDFAAQLLPKMNGRVHFDLAAANRLLLEKAGVSSIEDCAICTAEHLENWFSHRAEKGRTGRFGVLMALK